MTQSTINESLLKFYSDGEERLNVISHGLGMLFSVVALVLLILRAMQVGLAVYLFSFTVFGLSLVLLYAASTAYHMAKTPVWRSRLNRLDHMAIYVLIAGTYTPFALITLQGWVGLSIFIAVWGIALLGMVLKFFLTGRFDRLSTIAYVAMGWIVLFAIVPLVENLSKAGLFWLMAGGVLYTIGAILYSLRRLPYNHAIFHFFVLLGSTAHFMAIYRHV